MVSIIYQLYRLSVCSDYAVNNKISSSKRWKEGRWMWISMVINLLTAYPVELIDVVQVIGFTIIILGILGTLVVLNEDLQNNTWREYMTGELKIGLVYINKTEIPMLIFYFGNLLILNPAYIPFW
jgi:hypothetical protein